MAGMTILQKMLCWIILLTNSVLGLQPAAMPTFFTRPNYIPQGGFAVVDVANAAARLALPQLAAVGRVVSQADTASVWALKANGLAANAADWRCLGASAIASDNPPGSAAAASATFEVVSAVAGNSVCIGSRTYTLANRAKQACAMPLSGFCSSSGNVTVTVTGALLDSSPQVFSVAVQAGDSGVVVAGKIKTALEAAITVAYTPSVGAGMLALTAKVAAANDSTMAMAFTNGHGIPNAVSGYGAVPGNWLAPNTVVADPDPAAVVVNLVAAINGDLSNSVIISGISSPAHANRTLLYAGVSTYFGTDMWTDSGTQTPGQLAVLYKSGNTWIYNSNAVGEFIPSYIASNESFTASPAGLTGWTVSHGTGPPTVVAGGVYGGGTLPHEDGTAAASVDGGGYPILIFTASEVGTAGNAIPVSATIASGGVVGGWDYLTGGVDGVPAALLGQDCIVNEEFFYKCVSLSPVKWAGPFLTE